MKTRVTYFRCYLPLVAGILSGVITPVTAQNFTWVTHYSEPSEVRALNLTSAPSGDNYQFVEHTGAVEFNGHTFTGDGRVLVRHNAAGDFSWALDASRIQINEMKATNQHVYLAGTYTAGDFVAGHTFSATAGMNDGFIVRLTSQGVVDLVINISGPEHDDVLDLEVDKNGVMWITGQGSESLTFGDSATNHPGANYFMAGFDQNGHLKALSRSDAMSGLRISTNQTSDRIYVTAVSGANKQSIVFSGMTHTYTTTDFDSGDYFIIAYDGSGSLLATKHHYSAQKSSVACTDVGGNLDLYVTTTLPGETFARKYDKDLHLIWSTDIPGSFPYTSGLAADLTGNMYVIGRLPKSGPGHLAIVSKYSTGGQVLWQTLIALEDIDNQNTSTEVVGIDCDELGDVFIAGHFHGKAQFGNLGTFESGGNLDFFVARMDGQSDYTAIRNNTANDIMKVFPTISGGQLTIEMQKSLRGQLDIRNINGSVVHTEAIEAGPRKPLNVCLANGIYFVEFQANGAALQRSEIIIQH